MASVCGIIASLLTLACAAVDLTPSPQVIGTFKVESPFGSPVAGMSLTVLSSKSSATTDSLGKATLSVTAHHDFIVRGTKPPHYQDLYIFGSAGAAAFNYTTFMGTRLEARLLAHLVGVPYNASRGYIVIGIDDMLKPAAGLAPSNLIPAVGASAQVQGIHGPSPFVFDGVRPVNGQTITNRSSSFVTFPNVETGCTGSASTTPPLMQHCVVSPALSWQPQLSRTNVTAFPDSVSVVSFVCLNMTD